MREGVECAMLFPGETEAKRARSHVLTSSHREDAMATTGAPKKVTIVGEWRGSLNRCPKPMQPCVLSSEGPGVGNEPRAAEGASAQARRQGQRVSRATDGARAGGRQRQLGLRDGQNRGHQLCNASTSRHAGELRSARAGSCSFAAGQAWLTARASLSGGRCACGSSRRSWTAES